MIQNLFNVKSALNDLIPDVIKLIQYNYYLLYMKNDVMAILDDYFKFQKEDDKIYITAYKKVYHCYVNMGFNWFKSDNEQYITLNYKKIKIKNKYQYGLVIKMSSYSDLPSFKRIESRIMENTIYKKVKSRYNRIYLV